MRCSIVVPTFARPDLLDRCLQSLVRQDLAPDDYEVIVVDDAHSSATHQQVAECRARTCVALRYVATTRRASGPATARNVGWRFARGHVIAFTDDDTVADCCWLSKGLGMLEHTDAAWGRVIVPIPGTPTDYEKDAARLADAGFVTANCFCRREALERVGGFDERFRMAWREDSDLFFRLTSARLTTVYAPCAVVVHPIRPAPWGSSLGMERKHQFDALLYQKDPDAYRKHFPDDRPMRYYLIVLAALATLAGWLTGAAWIAWIGVTGWFLLTAAFVIERLNGTRKSVSHITEMIVTSTVLPWLSLYWRLRGSLTFRTVFW